MNQSIKMRIDHGLWIMSPMRVTAVYESSLPERVVLSNNVKAVIGPPKNVP